MFYKTALLGAVAFGFTVSATAQTASIEETKLDTIIVNGSRLDQTMTEIGSSVSVITRDDLEELGVDFALDAIATAPGVTVNQNGAFGGNASVRIRGASNDQTLVLIDAPPRNVLKEPYSPNTVPDKPSVGRLVVMDTTPPMASLPQSVDCGPFSTSIRSMVSVSR